MITISPSAMRSIPCRRRRYARSATACRAPGWSSPPWSMAEPSPPRNSRSALSACAGTLKAIGFKRGTITGLFLAEALLVATIGAAIGIGGAVLLYRSVDFGLIIPFFNSFVPTGQTLIAAFVLAILVGLISVVYSAYRVSGLTIAEALRSTE